MLYLLVGAAVVIMVIIWVRKLRLRISYPHNVFEKQERARRHGLGWRTKNGQWMPYPGKQDNR